MGTDLKERLKASQLKELQLISLMIARGEPSTTINVGWEKFLKNSKDELGASETEETKIDIMDLINHVLSEAYEEASRDLQYYAQKVKFSNDIKRQIRDDLSRTRKTLEKYSTSVEASLSSIGDDAQLANIDLQNALQKLQHTLQLMSNVSKMLHDTAMAVIRKIG